jgi:hypothetical protein
MLLLEGLDWAGIRRHYEDRVKESQNLRELAAVSNIKDFVELALGLPGKETGNYSAAEHNLGPKILASNRNALEGVYELAQKFLLLDNAMAVPELVRRAQMKYLQIGVGSEISCMVNPEVCWVCNTRTIWIHLANTQGIRQAEEALQLFREGSSDSDMAYGSWANAYHPELSPSLLSLANAGSALAMKADVIPGEISYLWADAIASAAYGKYHPRSSS